MTIKPVKLRPLQQKRLLIVLEKYDVYVKWDEILIGIDVKLTKRETRYLRNDLEEVSRRLKMSRK